MDLDFKCKFSLSKKMRSVLKNNNGRMVIVIDDIVDGLGDGVLLLSAENLDKDKAYDLLKKETSIHFVPNSLTADNFVKQDAVVNLFTDEKSLNNIKNKQDVSPFIKKIAVVNPPSKKDKAHAFKSKEEILSTDSPVLQEFTKAKNFISNLEELEVELIKNKDKVSSIDIDSISNPRERAVAIEKKNIEESIGTPAYIVNTKVKSIYLNDLDINLSKMTPFNLGRISSKKIAASKDLKSMISAGYIDFVSPDDLSKYDQGSIEELSDKNISDDIIDRNNEIDITEEVNGFYEKETDKVDGFLNLSGNKKIKTTYHTNK